MVNSSLRKRRNPEYTYVRFPLSLNFVPAQFAYSLIVGGQQEKNGGKGNGDVKLRIWESQWRWISHPNFKLFRFNGSTKQNGYHSLVQSTYDVPTDEIEKLLYQGSHQSSVKYPCLTLPAKEDFFLWQRKTTTANSHRHHVRYHVYV